MAHSRSILTTMRSSTLTLGVLALASLSILACLVTTGPRRGPPLFVACGLR